MPPTSSGATSWIAPSIFFTSALSRRTWVASSGRLFAVMDLHGNTAETVLSKVLGTAQNKGFEAAVQALESMGIPSAPKPARKA